MHASVLHLLAGLAVLIQSLPLRACEWEALLSDSNCHSRDPAAAALADHSDHDHSHGEEEEAEPGDHSSQPRPHDSGHGHVCPCDQPDQPAERTQHAPADALTAMPLDVSAVSAAQAARDLCPLTRPRSVASPPADLILPLLN